MERTASEILDVLGTFRKEWDAFSTKMDALGRNLTTTTRAFDELTGARTRQLERQLDRIDDLQRHRAVDVTDDGDASLLSLEPPAYAG
jgi:DNA anti-recombination protein RmuC